MAALWEAISRGIEQLLGRASGPLHMRLIITPAVVTLLAIRAGLRDARTGVPASFWELVSDPERRHDRILNASKDVVRIVIVAFVLDTVYQIFVLRAFYVVQALILVVACAILPYALVRRLTALLARCFRSGSSATSADDSTAPSQATSDDP